MELNIYPSTNDQSLSSYQLSYHYWRFKKYKELMEKRVKVTDSFLDIGCQEGILLKHLPKCNKYGVEIEKEYLTLAKKRNPGAHFRTGTIEKLPFDSNMFDWVSCTEVIEHVDDPVKALKEIKRVLKKNGHLLISTYNHWNIFNIVTGFVLLRKPKLDGHVREYNWLTFPRELSENFTIEVKTQAGSASATDKFFNFTKIPLAEFMIMICKKK